MHPDFVELKKKKPQYLNAFIYYSECFCSWSVCLNEQKYSVCSGFFLSERTGSSEPLCAQICGNVGEKSARRKEL